MTTLRIKNWTVDLVSPLRVRRVNSASAHGLPRSIEQPLHSDPTPTPGGFEPPLDLFRMIARGESGLE